MRWRLWLRLRLASPEARQFGPQRGSLLTSLQSLPPVSPLNVESRFPAFLLCKGKGCCKKAFNRVTFRGCRNTLLFGMKSKTSASQPLGVGGVALGGSTLFTQEKDRKEPLVGLGREGGPCYPGGAGGVSSSLCQATLCPSLMTAESPPGHLLGGSQPTHDTKVALSGLSCLPS